MLPLLLAACAADEPGPSLDAPTVNISTISTIFPMDYTKTVVFRYRAHTVTGTDASGAPVTSVTLLPVYIPTIIFFRPAATGIPGPTAYASQTYPPATKALVTVVFSPYILIGVPFLIVYVGGGCLAWRAALRQDYLKRQEQAAQRTAERRAERATRRSERQEGGARSASLASEPLLEWQDERGAAHAESAIAGPARSGYTRA
jgi:hypothetical protein